MARFSGFTSLKVALSGIREGRQELRAIRRSAVDRPAARENASRHFYTELKRLSELYDGNASARDLSRQKGKVVSLFLSRRMKETELRKNPELAKMRSSFSEGLKSFLAEAETKPPTDMNSISGFIAKSRQKAFLVFLAEPKFSPIREEVLPWFEPKLWKSRQGRKYIGWRTLTFGTAWGDFTNFLPVSEVIGGAIMGGLYLKANRDLKLSQNLQSTNPENAKKLAENAKFWKEKILDFRTLLTLNPVPGLQADYWLLFSPLFAASGVSKGQIARLNRSMLKSVREINVWQISERTKTGKRPKRTQLLIRKFFRGLQL